VKKKAALRLVALLGAAALGLLLWRGSPREVVLVYDLGAVRDARGLEVRITQGQDLLRRAEFPAPGRQVRHAMKLPDGTYHVRFAVDRPEGALRGERDIQVTESQTIVLSLAP
jgi:hypothetical protein